MAGFTALESFAVKVVAVRRGFYGDRMHYEAGSKLNQQRAGVPFIMRADGLTYDRDGRLHVGMDMKPILPSWVAPQEDVPVADKSIEQVKVDPSKPKIKKRKVPAAVKAVGPVAWPKSVRRRGDPDAVRPIKIKRAGTGQFQDNAEDEQEDGKE